MFKLKRIFKLISINALTLLFFIFIIELILGKWIKNFLILDNYVPIPALIRDKKLKFDISSIYGSKQKFSVYERDELGYRSRSFQSKKPIVLTIGGSTTDQRYINEGATWQDNLDKLIPKYDFINGGIDGQSSYGHLISIKLWHSQSLNPKEVEFIIFYIGINDRGLLRGDFNHYDKYTKPTNYFRGIFRDNSYFANKFYSLNRLKNINQVVFNIHKPREYQFLKKGEYQEIDKFINLNDFSVYANTFSNLISETKKKFPKTKLIFIQQQIPGCKFIDKERVLDRHPLNMERICEELIRVFKIQEKIIYSFNLKKELLLIPMFLEEVIEEKHVYDYVHTNEEGSRAIANYIKSKLQKELEF